MSKTKLMIYFSFNSLQKKFVGINAVVMIGTHINKNVPVEVHNYLITNSAAFLEMLAAVELNMKM